MMNLIVTPAVDPRINAKETYRRPSYAKAADLILFSPISAFPGLGPTHFF